MSITSIYPHRPTASAIIFALMLLCLCGCSKDEDDSMPAYKIDLAEIDTDHDGLVTVVRFDNGVTYTVGQKITAETADTTYRCMCTYFVDANQKLSVYGLTHVFSPNPRPRAEFKTFAYDPVNLTSSWKSGGYLNLRIGLLTTDEGSHSFGFCEDSVVNRKVYITLMHGRPEEDAESYTKDLFLSIPLKQYDCDSVFVRVPTYEGWQQIGR